MAIEAKMSFLGQAEKRIGGMVTAENMPRILAALAELLDGFEIREIPTGGGRTGGRSA